MEGTPRDNANERFLLIFRKPWRNPVLIQASTSTSPLIKYFVLGLSIFFWMLGFIYVILGYYVTDETGDFLYNVTVEPGAVVSFHGVVVILISIFGAVGALRENVFLLNIYKVLLVITLLLQVFSAFLSFAFFPEIKKILNKIIVQGIEEYWDNTALREYMDSMQQSFECCGALFVDDWDSNGYFNCAMVESYRSCGVPWSCCRFEYQRNWECGYGARKKPLQLERIIHTTGCLDVAFEQFSKTMTLLGGISVTFAVPMVAAVFLIHVLVGQIKRKADNVKVNGGDDEEWL